MIVALIIFIGIGVACGLWQEVSEQRRLGRMEKDFKAQWAGGKKA